MDLAALLHETRRIVAQPNYQFAKRQRDLAKQRKKEEKRLKKLAARQGQSGEAADPATPPPPADPAQQPS